MGESESGRFVPSCLCASVPSSAILRYSFALLAPCSTIFTAAAAISAGSDPMI